MPSDRTDLGGGRGLGRYGEPIADTYHDQTLGTEGTLITVQDSSAAMYDAAWLRLEGTAHVGEKGRITEYSPGTWFDGRWIPPTRIVNGTVSAHLNVEKAEQIIEALQTWVDRVKHTVDSTWEEDHAETEG